jgi:hypothetical protein
MSVDGTWKITVQSPMGPQASTVELVSDGSALTGTQSGGEGATAIYDGSVDGDITKPMKLTVTFTATVEGDSISGTAKAGMFPKSTFAGARA